MAYLEAGSLMHACHKMCLVVAACSIVGALASAQFDPIPLAIAELTGAGCPPPSGYSIGRAEPGSLPPTTLGRTDSEEKTIEIDLGKVGHFINHTGGGEDSEIIAIVKELLWHEYQHTEAYGSPSIPPATGYGNDICGHVDIYADSVSWTCETIEQRQSDDEGTESLCALNRTLVDVYNGSAALCTSPPPRDRLFPCGACAN